jgi:hypothetical protein
MSYLYSTILCCSLSIVSMPHFIIILIIPFFFSAAVEGQNYNYFIPGITCTGITITCTGITDTLCHICFFFSAAVGCFVFLGLATVLLVFLELAVSAAPYPGYFAGVMLTLKFFSCK